ncbi:related to Staphylococcus multidrug resistance protein [Ramularia collo-cygni]|uniref:Related to Staphylococcus multidrug resistance protein n=1 Tax=Ramularia collo-cygni TaxID=112498 RepID=A0A2D3VLL4_9PEZI|nr:related to Staphylococcus multidrug resistance protein [Ramularia collo-cygni]CZT23444.1 related to Staphylococcus multidrug resistance protein [Ramularia collo-cygni]
MSVVTRPFTWFYHEFGVVSIATTGRNAYLIILSRALRMFAYGTNTLILALFFNELGFTDSRIGLFMTLTLAGDVVLGTFLTLIADRVGRRKILFGGSFLMVLTGIIFASFENFWILLFAAVIGVVSATGADFGPFRSIEESILSQLTTPKTRSDVLAWYVTISAVGSSVGAESSGRIIEYLRGKDGWSLGNAYHALFWIYAVMGLVNAGLVLLLTEECEADAKQEESYAQVSQEEHTQTSPEEHEDGVEMTNGSHRTTNPQDILPEAPLAPSSQSRIRTWITRWMGPISNSTLAIVYKLWILLAIDSLADGMVPYSLTTYYLDGKFHPSKSTLGDITSVSYFLTAIGGIFAGPTAKKIGLVNTMVFTHLPSSAAVLIFPFPNIFWMAALLLFIRAGLNNMDQAPRAALIAAVVKPQERTAVMGITSMLRTLAATTGPMVTGFLAAGDRFWIAFVAGGAFRITYDVGLFIAFKNIKLHRYETTQEVGPVEGDFSLQGDSDDDDYHGEDDHEALK